MRLPLRQPQRWLVAFGLYVLGGAIGAVGLLALGGTFLGGVLAFFWLSVMTVPAAVLARLPKGT